MKQIVHCLSKLSAAKNAVAVLLTAVLLMGLSNTGKAQILITLHKETFPNKTNEVLSAPINQSFTGNGGTWSAYSTNALSTIGCFPAPYSPVTNAVKFLHSSTAGSTASDAYATSPVFNLGNPGCNGKYDVSFNLYTYNCISGDNNAYLALDISNDGGTTWSTAWQKTSGQMYSNWGPNGLTNIWFAISSSYLTPNFRYRFRSHMNANDANNFYVFIDEPTIWAYSCSDMMNLGNLVWLDLNQNGIKDGAELGLAGVPLELTRDNDLDGYNDWDFTPKNTVTDINGNYSFNDINAGRYKVSLVGMNTTYRLTGINAGEPDEDGDNNNNGLSQSVSFANVNGGWITLLPQSEPTADGDGNNGNLTYDFAIFPASALPVKSVNLSLNRNDNETTINWSTINEVNVLHFEVERSVDNKKFERIATKASVAQSNGDASYTVTDITGNNFASVVYYRIKIVDKDGRYSYSNTATVKINISDAVVVWPNPFVNEIKISHTAKGAEKIQVKIADNTGRIIKAQSFNCAAGSNMFSIGSLDNLAKGLYTVTVSNNEGGRSAVIKIMK